MSEKKFEKWTIASAYQAVIIDKNPEAIIDIGKKYPLVLNALSNLETLILKLPENVTCRKMFSILREEAGLLEPKANDNDNDEEEVVEEKPAKKKKEEVKEEKPAKKAKKVKEPEPEEEDEEDDEEEVEVKPKKKVKKEEPAPKKKTKKVVEDDDDLDDF